MKELVKYNNYLNALEFKGFTASDYDFLMYLCAVMRDQDEDIITLSLNEIKRLVNYDMHVSTEEFGKLLESMNKKLMQITASVKDGSRTIQFVLFPTFISDFKTNTLTVRVNPDFKYLLNELTKNFTMFELQEFIELNSKYSKTLYRLLKQYRNTGEYHVNVDELRKLLGCPESYPNNIFMSQVIAPAVKELQKDFPLLKCETIRAQKRGRPVVGYYFTFRADQGEMPGQLSLDQGLDTIKQYTARKERDKPKQESKPQKDKKPKPTKFNNFSERDYNYNELESLLTR